MTQTKRAVPFRASGDGTNRAERLLGVFYRLNVFAVASGLAYVHRYLVRFFDPAVYLHGLAVVITQRHFDQVQLIVANDGHVDLAVAEYQRVVGDHRNSRSHRHGEFRGRVHSGIERLIFVGEIDFHQHRARVGRECLGMTRDGPDEFLTGVAGRGNRGRIAVLDERRDILRHIDKHAQGSHAGYADDCAVAGRARGGVRGHEVAGIDIARRHDAVEGRRDCLVGLIGDVLFEGSERLQHRSMGIIGSLLRNYLGAYQFLVALVSDEGEVVVGARIGGLLVEFGRREDGNQLAGMDAVALVDLDGLQVAGNLGVDVGLVEAANGRRQLESAGR